MINKFINKIKDKELRAFLASGLVFGLVFGLAYGLVFGLASGFAFGLGSGLVFGLAYGLVIGLASGFAFGLASGLVFELASGLVFGLANLNKLLPLEFYWIFMLIVSIFILSECLFYGKGYKKGSKFWFTFRRKIIALIESLVIIINLLNFKWFVMNHKLFSKMPYQIVLNCIGYIGVGLLASGMVIGIFYLWIKLNEGRVKRK